jgi:hypothetical protein
MNVGSIMKQNGYNVLNFKVVERKEVVGMRMK